MLRNLIRPKRRRQSLYPALWAWEQARPVDVKDIRDKRALGTALCDHLAKRGLPRYQWTAIDGLTLSATGLTGRMGWHS